MAQESPEFDAAQAQPDAHTHAHTDAQTDARVRRAEETLDGAGQRLGALAAAVAQRAQAFAANSAQATRQAVARSQQALQGDAGANGAEGAASGTSGTSGPGGSGANLPPATARAEELVDEAGRRLTLVASVAGDRLRWLFARAREEGDDIWAEAQHVRRPGAPPTH